MVDANLGNSEIQTRDLRLPARQVNALSTRPRRLVRQEISMLMDKTFYVVKSETSSLYIKFLQQLEHKLHQNRLLQRSIVLQTVGK